MSMSYVTHILAGGKHPSYSAAYSSRLARAGRHGALRHRHRRHACYPGKLRSEVTVVRSGVSLLTDTQDNMKRLSTFSAVPPAHSSCQAFFLFITFPRQPLLSGQRETDIHGTRSLIGIKYGPCPLHLVFDHELMAYMIHSS